MSPVATQTSSSPSHAILESTMNDSGLPRPLLVVGLSLTILYMVAPHTFNWFHPCQSVDVLQELITNIKKMIRDNNSIAKRNFILRDHAAGFRTRLREFEDKVNEFKQHIRDEPSRDKVLAWAMFKWKLVKRVDECYAGLRKLEGEIQTIVDSAAKA
ncbi:hypothetical protein VNI00_013306 [Paramarasmius palmivorus]|uniref:Uncharacterized protein n=1 Tax=Paramarasmius palmivorus TaxID=297713 RepID=A0AAW0BYB9_9AGAR